MHCLWGYSLQYRCDARQCPEAQLQLPQYAAQKGHMKVISRFSLCVYRFLFVSSLAVTLWNKTLAKGFQQKLFPRAHKS